MRLENIVSNALKKELHYLEDTQGVEASLHYLRTKEGKEIDFLITIDGKPKYCMEVKTHNDSPNSAFDHFSKFLPPVTQIQLVKNIIRSQQEDLNMIIKVAFTRDPVEDMEQARNFYETILHLNPGSISSQGAWGHLCHEIICIRLY